MQKTIPIADVKVGNRLPDTENRGYGYFKNRVVDRVRITKGGRYDIFVTDIYINVEGVEGAPKSAALFNGPKKGSYQITIIE